jgi:hypothetical protein
MWKNDGQDHQEQRPGLASRMFVTIVKKKDFMPEPRQKSRL